MACHAHEYITHINFIAIKLQIFWQPREQLIILIVLACSLQGRRDTDRMHYEFYIIIMNSWLHTFIYSIIQFNRPYS